MKPYPFWRSIAYSDSRRTKMRWHSQARAKLRAIAKELGLEPGTYDIRSNMGGVAVSGEAILHGEHVYVQVSQHFGHPGNGILFRRVNGRKDYTGERNHVQPLEDLNNPGFMAALIERRIGPVK